MSGVFRNMSHWMDLEATMLLRQYLILLFARRVSHHSACLASREDGRIFGNLLFLMPWRRGWIVSRVAGQRRTGQLNATQFGKRIEQGLYGCHAWNGMNSQPGEEAEAGSKTPSGNVDQDSSMSV